MNTTHLLLMNPLHLLSCLFCIVFAGGRPVIKAEWPQPLQEVLQMGFDASPEKRPSMEFIFETLRSELCQARGGRTSKLGDSYILRNRSFDSVFNDEDDVLGNRPGRMGDKLRASFARIGRMATV